MRKILYHALLLFLRSFSTYIMCAFAIFLFNTMTETSKWWAGLFCGVGAIFVGILSICWAGDVFDELKSLYKECKRVCKR